MRKAGNEIQRRQKLRDSPDLAETKRKGGTGNYWMPWFTRVFGPTVYRVFGPGATSMDMGVHHDPALGI